MQNGLFQGDALMETHSVSPVDSGQVATLLLQAGVIEVLVYCKVFSLLLLHFCPVYVPVCSSSYLLFCTLNKNINTTCKVLVQCFMS